MLALLWQKLIHFLHQDPTHTPLHMQTNGIMSLNMQRISLSGCKVSMTLKAIMAVFEMCRRTLFARISCSLQCCVNREMLSRDIRGSDGWTPCTYNTHFQWRWYILTCHIDASPPMLCTNHKEINRPTWSRVVHMLTAGKKKTKATDSKLAFFGPKKTVFCRQVRLAPIYSFGLRLHRCWVSTSCNRPLG